MEINLDLAGLFAQVFGVGVTQEVNRLQKENAPETKHPKSKIRAPFYGDNGVFLPAKITYSDPTVASAKNTSVVLPYAVCAINSRKIIVETPLTERRGTVKEVIAMSDYEIMVRGFCIGKPRQYPEDDVMALRKLYELVGQTVQLMHAVTDIFLLGADRKGSDLVVLRDIMLPDMQGVANVQPYQISLISDTPFNLIDLS